MRGSRWIAPGLWALLLLGLGRRTGGGLPADLPGLDKVAHAVFYGVLGFLVGRTQPRAPVAVALLAGLVVGGLDEWSQSFVPGRHSDWADLLADVCGAAAGGWLAGRTLARRRRSAD